MKIDTESFENCFSRAWRALRVPPSFPHRLELVQLHLILGDRLEEGEEGEDNVRHWINTFNSQLGYCPAERLTDKDSLQNMLFYLRSLTLCEK